MTFSVQISIAKPNVTTKWRRCLTDNSGHSGNCPNGTPLIHGTCNIFYGADPCSLYNYWIEDSDGNFKRVGCCSVGLNINGNGEPDPNDFIVDVPNSLLTVNSGYNAYNLVASNGEVHNIPVFDFEYLVGNNWTIAEVDIVSYLDGVMIYVGNPDSLFGQYINIDSVFVPGSLIESNFNDSLSNMSQSLLPENDQNSIPNGIYGIPKDMLFVNPQNINWSKVKVTIGENIIVEKNSKSKFIEIDKVYIRVFDLQGKIVHEEYINKKEEQIMDLSHLRHGMYIFFCEINGIPIRKKIFKNK
jgi:hypothetical protein